MELVPVKPHRVRRAFGLILSVTVGLWLFFFLGFVVYYLWQSKYGSPQEIAQTRAEFQSNKFTAATNDKEKPRAPVDWANYIAKNNPILGSQASPVIITAFIDFECPFSQEGYQTFKSVIETYGGAARIVFKQLPLTSLHSNALAAAEASACANEQGKFWAYYDHLFATKKLSPADLNASAVAVGLNLTDFNNCQASGKFRSLIEQDVNDAIALGVRGTPTYFVNNDVIEGVAERSVWDKIILGNLKK